MHAKSVNVWFKRPMQQVLVDHHPLPVQQPFSWEQL